MKLQGDDNEARKYQVYLRSSGGPIGIYILSQHEQAHSDPHTPPIPSAVYGLRTPTSCNVLGTPTDRGTPDSAFFHDHSQFWNLANDNPLPLQLPNMDAAYEGNLGGDEGLADMY